MGGWKEGPPGKAGRANGEAGSGEQFKERKGEHKHEIKATKSPGVSVGAKDGFRGRDVHTGDGRPVKAETPSLHQRGRES